MLLLTRKEVEDLLEPGELLSALEEGFKALSSNQISAPPRNQAVAENGLLVGMPAYMPGRAMSVKLVTIFHENRKYNVPDHQATITLFDSQTGTPIAFMDGEYITAMRTAAGAVLSIKHLARKNSNTLAIIGAGVLGQAHLQMIGTLTGLEKILVASKEFSKAQALASRDPRALAVDSVREAVSQADVVCLCTSSPVPVLQADWLKGGVHVTSVGYRPPGGELPLELVEAGRVFVESRVAYQAPPVGSAELQGLDPETGTEMGELILKQRPGRLSDHEVTIYKSMGHAMEDLVTANLVHQKAISKNIGSNFEL